ncbi:hypothetical protein D3C84_864640 [compost metagenome]
MQARLRKGAAQVAGELGGVGHGGDFRRRALRVGHAPVVEGGKAEAFGQPVQHLRGGAHVFAAAGEVDEQVLQRVFALRVVDVAAHHAARHGVRVGREVVRQMHHGQLAGVEKNVALARGEQGPVGGQAANGGGRGRQGNAGNLGLGVLLQIRAPGKVAAWHRKGRARPMHNAQGA